MDAQVPRSGETFVILGLKHDIKALDSYHNVGWRAVSAQNLKHPFQGLQHLIRPATLISALFLQNL